MNIKKDIKKVKIDPKAVLLLNKLYTESFSFAPYFWSAGDRVPFECLSVIETH